MSERFRYEALPVVDAFERLSDPAAYTPLPDDWQVGVADVVDSTVAMQAGRYKAVNMAGASVVSGVMNALGHAPFPFLFAGDGAAFAVEPSAAAAARASLSATVRYVEEELALSLRAGMMPVAAIRAAGRDVRVARFAASDHAAYAMFGGGGVSHAEAELKAGRIAIEPAPEGARPDLTGLSCRWSPIESRRGVILSILVFRTEGANLEAFRGVVQRVIALTSEEDRGGHPVAVEGPEFSLSAAGVRLETGATATGSAAARALRIAGETALAMAADRVGTTIGAFDPRRYRAGVARNTDFRKFEDGLMMTIDCAPALADAIEATLASAEEQRVVDYGLHRQTAALMTCIVPSVIRDDHLHFVDGAGGGYAYSAQALKQRVARRNALAAPSAA